MDGLQAAHEGVGALGSRRTELQTKLKIFPMRCLATTKIMGCQLPEALFGKVNFVKFNRGNHFIRREVWGRIIIPWFFNLEQIF